MRKLALLLIVLSAAALFHPQAGAQSSRETPAAPAAPQANLDRVLRRYERLRLDVPGAVNRIRRGEPLSLPTSEGVFEVELVPNDLRGESYRAEETVADGSRLPVAEVAEVHTFRGSVRGLGQAEARFNLSGGAFEGMIVTPAERFYFERLGRHDAAAAPDEFIFYRGSDVVAEGADFCALTLEDQVRHEALGVAQQVQTAPLVGAAAATVREADVATEADYEYVTALGGSAAANAEILSIMNLIDGIYETQLSVSLKVVYQHAWASKPPGYPFTASTEGDTVLGEFGSYWNSNFASVNRDIAHLWTGRDLTAGGNNFLAGIAWTGIVCIIPSASYGVSERMTNLTFKQELTAHEIGHNFSASHSDGIMGPSLSGSLTFGPVSQSEITSFLNSHGTCLAPVAALNALTLSAPSTVGGAPVTGTVTLTAPAPASGAVVTLSDDIAATTLPASVTVAAGQTSKTFTVTTAAVTTTQAGTVTAAYNRVQKTAALSVTRGFSISGAVLNGTAGVGGVKVTLTSTTAGFTPRTTTTSLTGAYSFALVPAGHSYSVTASSAVYSFTPASRPYTNLSANQSGQNFVATRRNYAIAGRVLLGTSGLNGVVMQLKNSAGAVLVNATTATSAAGVTGSYTFANVPAGFNYTVAPASSAIYSYTPASRPFTNLSANQASQNFVATRRSYAITGRVLLGTAGLNGVPVQLRNGAGVVIATSTTATSAAGTAGIYSFPAVPAGLNYTVAPASSVVYSYTPASRPFTNLSANQSGQNFTAARKLYAISGRVLRAGSTTVGVSGVTLTLVNSQTLAVVKTTTTAADGTGMFSLTGVPAGISYTLRPSKPGATFTPTSKTYANLSANQASQNFSSP